MEFLVEFEKLVYENNFLLFVLSNLLFLGLLILLGEFGVDIVVGDL